MAFATYYAFGNVSSFRPTTAFVQRRDLVFQTPQNKCSSLKVVKAVMDDTAGQQRKQSWRNMELKFVSKNLCVDGRTCLQLRQHIEEVLKGEGEPVRWAVVESNEEDGTCRVDAVVTTS